MPWENSIGVASVAGSLAINSVTLTVGKGGTGAIGGAGQFGQLGGGPGADAVGLVGRCHESVRGNRGAAAPVLLAGQLQGCSGLSNRGRVRAACGPDTEACRSRRLPIGLAQDGDRVEVGLGEPAQRGGSGCQVPQRPESFGRRTSSRLGQFDVE